MNISKNEKTTASKATAPPLFPPASLPVMLCDQLNAEAVIIDLAANDPTSDDAILWRWTPSAENGFEALGFGHRIDDCKLKYSASLQKHVICVTSSAGFIGLAEYPSGKMLWEDLAKGYGPHSIDYLPSGNLVVALSGNGNKDKCELRIYACDETGLPTKDYFKLPFSSAHGVVWDGGRNVVWALGHTVLTAVEVGGTPQAPTLKQLEDLSCEIRPSGHDLSASLSDPNRLYLSAHSIYLFDKATHTLLESFDGDELIKAPAVKCIAEHTDGSLLRTVATGVFAPHNTDRFDVFRKSDDGTWAKATYVFKNRAFYKARPVIV